MLEISILVDHACRKGVLCIVLMQRLNCPKYVRSHCIYDATSISIHACMQKENVLTVSDDDDVSQLNHSVSYSIKVVNPAKKSDYHIYTIRDSVEFRTVKS